MNKHRITLTVEVTTKKSLQDVQRAIDRSLFRGLDSEGHRIARPSNVIIKYHAPETEQAPKALLNFYRCPKCDALWESVYVRPRFECCPSCNEGGDFPYEFEEIIKEES